MEERSYSSTIFDFGIRKMVNGQYYAPVALPPEKEPLIPT
jgi:hypothetical protein